MEVGLDDEEVRVFRRMQSRLRKAGFSSTKRVYQARALEYVFALRYRDWYAALDKTSSTAIACLDDMQVQLRLLRRIEREATPKPSPAAEAADQPRGPFDA